MQCVTAVDGHWLAELGHIFFSFKETARSRMEKKRETVEHIRDMDAEMKEAEEDMRKQKEEQAIQEQQTAKKYEIVTPGRFEPNTPRRLPSRFGL
jgi:pre-mRNA-splicing factor ATP-dependent RNA helicase DHX38/PRP16